MERGDVWGSFDDRHLDDRARIHNDLHAAGIDHHHNGAGDILIAAAHHFPDDYYNDANDKHSTVDYDHLFGSADHTHPTPEPTCSFVGFDIPNVGEWRLTLNDEPVTPTDEGDVLFVAANHGDTLGWVFVDGDVTVSGTLVHDCGEESG